METRVPPRFGIAVYAREGKGPWRSGEDGTLVRAELAAARRLRRPDPAGFEPDAGSELFRGDAGSCHV